MNSQPADFVAPVIPVPIKSLDEVFQETAVATATDYSDDYRIRIPSFEGPLDLLLHLIRREQLNIYDIPIAQICSAYLHHIEAMTQPDVNLAGEFLVMAATLMHIKSQILLPQEKADTEEEDPRLPLVQQLLEYERFKDAAMRIDAMPWVQRDVFLRPPGMALDMLPTESLLDVAIDPIDTFQLLLALRGATERTTRPPMQISSDPTSIKDKVVAITVYMENHETMEFAQLLPAAWRVRDVIVSFLAILELAKLKFIEILQHENLGPIQLRATKSLSELDAALLDTY